MNRTFKGSATYGNEDRVEVPVRKHPQGKSPWVTVHYAGRFLGAIDSVDTLRRFHAALGEALPPKRGQK